MPHIPDNLYVVFSVVDYTGAVTNGRNLGLQKKHHLCLSPAESLFVYAREWSGISEYVALTN